MIRNVSSSGHYTREDHANGAASVVVGGLGLVGWLLAAAALAYAARARSSLGNLAYRLAVYAFLLAFLYPLAAFNRFVWARPGEPCEVSLSLVALNALAWAVALVEVIAYYLRYDGAPSHWTSYDTLTFAVKVLVTAFAVVSSSDEATRYVAMVLVVPIVALLVTAATREAGEQRAIHLGALPRSWRTLSRPRCVFVLLAAVGLYAFVVEVLSPALTCVTPIGVYAVLMTLEHVGLGALLVYVAYGASDAEQQQAAAGTSPPAAAATAPSTLSLLHPDDAISSAPTTRTGGTVLDWDS